jgi:hypothetical protein
MSPTQLVIGVFLFLIGFLVGRWVLERGPASQVEQRPERRSMPAAFARVPMPAAFARGRAA